MRVETGVFRRGCWGPSGAGHEKRHAGDKRRAPPAPECDGSGYTRGTRVLRQRRPCPAAKYFEDARSTRVYAWRDFPSTCGAASIIESRPSKQTPVTNSSVESRQASESPEWLRVMSNETRLLCLLQIAWPAFVSRLGPRRLVPSQSHEYG